MRPNLSRKDIILACMATCASHTYTPVQMQKLVFLVDQLKAEVGGPYFNFQPYHYGPFDKAVYEDLLALQCESAVEIVSDERLKMSKYRLLSRGEACGRAILDTFTTDTRNYIQNLSDFVRQASFADLVSAVYDRFPEMKVNSIFKG